MCALPSSFLSELKNRITLSDLVRPAVSGWDKRKSNAARRDWWCPCPFHPEKSSSFHVDDNKGFYHCFGCGVHGSVIDWVTQTQKMSFGEALRYLADMAGMTLPEISPSQAKKQEKARNLYDILKSAAQFYQQNLKNQIGKEALEYLRQKRGVDDTIITEFSIGYAPNHATAVLEYLQKEGFPLEQIIASGLVIQPEDGRKAFDRFRNRIMFPVKDRRGKIVTFGGRSLDKDAKAKYLNGPETDIFYKSQMLYNLDKAAPIAAKNGTLLVCEGYMDVIALHKAGFPYAVAPMGTALTDNQIDLLWQCASEPILCFDGDKAGINAAWRAIERILPRLQAGRSVRFIFLSDRLDPDDFIKAKGAGAFGHLLQNAHSLSHVLFVRELNEVTPDTPERIAGLEARLYTAIKHIPDERLRELYKQDIKKRLAKLTGQAVVKTSVPYNKTSKAFEKYQKELPKSEMLKIMKQQSDSFFSLEARIIGLYIHFGFYMQEEDFSILSEFMPHNDEYKRIKMLILNKFFLKHKKNVEISVQTDSFTLHEIVSQTHRKQGDYYIQDKSSAFSHAVHCLDDIAKTFYLHFINQNDPIFYIQNLRYENIKRHQDMTIIKQELDYAHQEFSHHLTPHNEKRYITLKRDEQNIQKVT